MSILSLTPTFQPRQRLLDHNLTQVPLVVTLINFISSPKHSIESSPGVTALQIAWFPKFHHYNILVRHQPVAKLPFRRLGNTSWLIPFSKRKRQTNTSFNTQENVAPRSEHETKKNSPIAMISESKNTSPQLRAHVPQEGISNLHKS